MKKKIDNLNRIVIPKPYVDELGITDEIEIDKVGNKIIITNPDGMRSKEEVEKMLKDVMNLEEDDYLKGFKEALLMVLNKE